MGLNDSFIYKGEIYNTGDKVTCTLTNRVSGFYIKDAKVYVALEGEYDIIPNQFFEEGDKIAFICHNEYRLSGNKSPDKLGYNYSWRFYIKKGEILTDDVRDLKLAQKENYIDKILDLAFPVVPSF